jgi:hypothetical protein
MRRLHGRNHGIARVLARGRFGSGLSIACVLGDGGRFGGGLSIACVLGDGGGFGGGLSFACVL